MWCGGVWLAIIGDDVGLDPLPFTATSGPQHVSAHNAKPMEYLKWFLNDSLLNSVVTETKRYINQFVNNNRHYLNVHPHSAVHTWIKEGNTTKE